MMWRKFVGGACAAAMLTLLAGCGGSSASVGSTTGGSQSNGSGQSGSGGSPTQTVQGIATPSSVSVVTANNSN